MGFFNFGNFKNKPKNKPAVTDYSANGALLTSFFGGDKGLTEEDVLKIPTVQASLELITSSIGQLPVKLFKTQDEGSPKVIDDDYRLHLLNDEPNENLTGYLYKKKITRDTLLYGVSKTQVEYKSTTSNKIDALYPLDTKHLIIEVYSSDGYKHYGIVHLTNESGSFDFYDDSLLSVLKDSDDGVTGKGILAENDDTLRLALRQQDYESDILANNATPNGILKTDQKLSGKDVARQLASSWNNALRGHAGSTVVLEQGLDYKPVSFSPENLQLKDSKAYIISQIARMFNVPESMVNASANKYNALEENYIIFQQNTLAPLIESIKTAFNKTLLTEKEKEQGYFFDFDMSQLMKTTWKEQIANIKTEYDEGMISHSEMREALGLADNVTNDFIKLSLGDVLYHPETGAITIPNMGSQLSNSGQSITQFNTDDATISSNNEKSDEGGEIDETKPPENGTKTS